ncbi:PREDICTED: uncharacterized protein LOC104803918 [Tarenaya hassleriana]|uniref:uncharacterized protein LOC104803918 n=1 Tax=Tarenaya hassleriana TaxID=28532 RepID=UPI00053C4BBC|nr:PREDICTED: uncharacterized protein LOC104803918 [Tarenaya hassleriana]
MRKMKKDSASAASCADPRIRLKHETLMEDYQELEKENEVTRRNLEMMKQTRSTLRAEVRFLKRRYNDLMQDRSHGTSLEMMRLSESGDFRVSSEVNAKRKKQTAGMRLPVACFDMKQKSTMYNGKEAMEKSTGDLGKKQKRNKGNNGNKVSRTPMSLPDLNQTERTCNGDGNTSNISKVLVFDLNEISREEGSQANGKETDAEDMKSRVLGNDELQGEIKLPICKNVKKGLNRGVKRKVSWQDPVALRVLSS